MPERHSPAVRSEMMGRVRSKNTAPELTVRRCLHANGYRFRLHKKSLPGSPDIVLAKYNLCIFVHGCFWHRHANCGRASIPQTNGEFWVTKFGRNVERDVAVQKALRELGWRVSVIWECQIKDTERASQLILGKVKSGGCSRKGAK